MSLQTHQPVAASPTMRTATISNGQNHAAELHVQRSRPSMAAFRTCSILLYLPWRSTSRLPSSVSLNFGHVLFGCPGCSNYDFRVRAWRRPFAIVTNIVVPRPNKNFHFDLVCCLFNYSSPAAGSFTDNLEMAAESLIGPIPESKKCNFALVLSSTSARI